MQPKPRADIPPNAGTPDDPEATFEELLRQIGARTRALREAQGLTIPLLAELAGVDGAALSRIENGQKNCRLKTADHIARGIGVHTYELFIPAELSDLDPSEQRHSRRRARQREPIEEQERLFREFLAHVGSRIRELRRLQGLSAPVLADFIGMSPHVLDAIEAGRTNISIKTADRVARGIGVHTHELFIPRERSELTAAPAGDQHPPSGASDAKRRAARTAKKRGAKKRTSEKGAKRSGRARS